MDCEKGPSHQWASDQRKLLEGNARVEEPIIHFSVKNHLTFSFFFANSWIAKILSYEKNISIPDLFFPDCAANVCTEKSREEHSPDQI